MEIYAGTAGWSYPDWYGPFYPEKKEKAFSELKFYADFFDCVEINSTFYRHFPPSTAEKWLAEVKKNPNFVFIVKLFQQFTHGSRQKDKEFLNNRSVVIEFLSPLVEQKKLAGILVQFSEYYRENEEAEEYVALIIDMFRDYTLFFELRHTSWYTARAKEFYKQNGVNVVAIDQPKLNGMIGFDADVLGKIGYVRMHGRNAETWQAGREALRAGKRNDNEDRNARYNYLYNISELDEIEEKLNKVKERCERMYLIMNNHPLGKAVVNALELVRRLRGDPTVRVPSTILKYFPEMGKFAERVDVGPLGDLFE
ncbi:MAG TPA: DUF72 domain-containing protein [Candidatus Acidoferrales bacterium]|nr:DUF72 domain-containing protein [Candidatus Acidoferrales bacterium]